MTRWPLILILGAAMSLSLAVSASAQPDRTLARDYFDGTFASTKGLCLDGNEQTVTNAWAGFYADVNEPYPKTGDLGYVRAVAANVNGCFLNDVNGFEFFLPDGASLAISQANPVYCFATRFDGTGYTPIPSGGNGACMQTPEAGQNGGLFFGYAQVPPGWMFQIQVPVIYNKQLLGIGGPNSHRLTIAASSAYTPAYVFPYQAVTVFYQARFQNLASSGITASTANLSLDLTSYFKAGSLYIDYSTTNPPPTGAGGQAPASIPDTSLGFNITSPLSGLTPSTPYYWRARFVTASGTFTSTVGTFTTSGAASQLLTVNKSGTGTVTSSPPGIDCGLTCSASFSGGVTLSASPATGWRFGGWSGEGCSGTGTCVVQMTQARTVNAPFYREIGSLSMTVAGLPAGNSVTLGVTGPDGFSNTFTIMTGTGMNLSDVVTGLYTVTAPNTTVSGVPYSPTQPTYNGTVTFGNTTTIDVVYTQQGVAAPTNVVATAASATSVSISWTASAGATSYEVVRVGVGMVATVVGTTGSTALTDSTASANTSYLFKVRAVAPSASPFSTPDLATTVVFTDPTINAKLTLIKADHVTQLRTAVNAVRTLAGLGGGTYTDPALTVGVTLVKGAHVVDLRNALATARQQLFLPVVTYTNSVLVAMKTPVSALDITQLRNAVK
jgi:Fibronectin type III domain